MHFARVAAAETAALYETRDAKYTGRAAVLSLLLHQCVSFAAIVRELKRGQGSSLWSLVPTKVAASLV